MDKDKKSNYDEHNNYPSAVTKVYKNLSDEIWAVMIDPRFPFKNAEFFVNMSAYHIIKEFKEIIVISNEKVRKERLEEFWKKCEKTKAEMEKQNYFSQKIRGWRR